MIRSIACGALAVALSACGVEEAPTSTSTVEQHGINMQGIRLQGINMQGIRLQGMNMLGYRFTGATLRGAPLDNVRVSRGELIAHSPSGTVRGLALSGAQLVAETRDITVNPPRTELVTFRIGTVTAEDPKYDEFGTGHSFLYPLEQLTDSGSWVAACSPDTDGRSVAIPLAAIWNEHGDRVESSSLFTFGCTTGVIAKCYRWGYRPWVAGMGDLVAAHQTCTRAARADYCGVGVSSTRDGTRVNLWDRVSPHPIMAHEFHLGYLFEAGWNTDGAVCLSHSRWLLDDVELLLELCPDRLVPPGLFGTVCDTVGEVLGFDANALILDETRLNLLPL